MITVCVRRLRRRLVVRCIVVPNTAELIVSTPHVYCACFHSVAAPPSACVVSFGVCFASLVPLRWRLLPPAAARARLAALRFSRFASNSFDNAAKHQAVNTAPPHARQHAGTHPQTLA
mgnify:CR=1 FL=1